MEEYDKYFVEEVNQRIISKQTIQDYMYQQESPKEMKQYQIWKNL